MCKGKNAPGFGKHLCFIYLFIFFSGIILIFFPLLKTIYKIIVPREQINVQRVTKIGYGKCLGGYSGSSVGSVLQSNALFIYLFIYSPGEGQCFY